MFFNIGIQAWFNQRVQSALDQSSQVAQGYLDEHNNDITVAALTIANDLFQNGSIYLGDSSGLANFLSQEVGIRGLTEAAIIDPVTREQIATAGIYLGGIGPSTIINGSAGIAVEWIGSTTAFAAIFNPSIVRGPKSVVPKRDENTSRDTRPKKGLPTPSSRQLPLEAGGFLDEPRGPGFRCSLADCLSKKA